MNQRKGMDFCLRGVEEETLAKVVGCWMLDEVSWVSCFLVCLVCFLRGLTWLF